VLFYLGVAFGQRNLDGLVLVISLLEEDKAAIEKRIGEVEYSCAAWLRTWLVLEMDGKSSLLSPPC